MDRPHIFGSVAMKCVPAVSTTLGRAELGKENRPSAQLAQLIVNGSKNPVADAEDTSVMCSFFPENVCFGRCGLYDYCSFASFYITIALFIPITRCRQY